MKLEIFLVLATLCVLISARPKERIWGDTHRPELGREMVHKVKTEGEKYTTYTFTYPRIPSDNRIVGVRQLDRQPPTKVEFIKGNIGDYQITVKVTAELQGNDLDCVFAFYTNKFQGRN